MTDTGHRPATPRSDLPSPFADGAAVGIGSLPHRDAQEATKFAISEFEIATIPTLPMRSPAESMIAQAVLGLPGISIDQTGRITVEHEPVSVGESSRIELSHDGFVGFNTFLEHAKRTGLDGSPVKWQYVGPVTLGVALHRAGLDVETAFDAASAALSAQLADISDLVAHALPRSPQMVVLDEPWFADLMTLGFPIPPDEAIDRMSSAMATLPSTTLVRVHCCAPCDVATLLASGPSVVSLPASPELVEWSGYLSRYIADGGIVAWGVVPTDGPIPVTSERFWRALSDLWCTLVQRGCDPVMLRRNSVVTPHCGLATHSESAALQVARLTAEVAKRVKDQSTATRFALGA
jgi:methionine synthase II (cobalamin-independent)